MTNAAGGRPLRAGGLCAWLEALGEAPPAGACDAPRLAGPNLYSAARQGRNQMVRRR